MRALLENIVPEVGQGRLESIVDFVERHIFRPNSTNYDRVTLNSESKPTLVKFCFLSCFKGHVVMRNVNWVNLCNEIKFN